MRKHKRYNDFVLLPNPDFFLPSVKKEMASYKEVIKRVRDKQITIQNNVNKVIMNVGLNENTKPLYKEYLNANKQIEKQISRAFAVLNAPKAAFVIAGLLYAAGRGAYYASGYKKLGASKGTVAGQFVRGAVLGDLGQPDIDGQSQQKLFSLSLITPFIAGWIGGKIGLKMIKSPSDLARVLNQKLEETRNCAMVFIATAINNKELP